MMKIYKVKAQFLDIWTDKDINELIVSEKDIQEIAKSCTTPVQYLMEMVEYCGQVKYEISTENFAFRYTGGSKTEEDIMEMYERESTHYPALLDSYNTKQEAYKAWREEYMHHAETSIEHGNGNLRYLRCTVTYLEEIVMDDNGDADQINSLEMAVQPYRDLEDVLDHMRRENGSVVDDYNDEYILLEKAYIDGSQEAPYYTALAINDNAGSDSCGMYPVYQIKWNPLQEWLDGDRADEGNACNWDDPDEIQQISGEWIPDEETII